MSDLPAAQQQALELWANDAITAGWLDKNASSSLHETVVADPGQLFSVENRPLVVGLFGGTGVGKSTLLNRFAGAAIAKASAERPTSRSITLYVHESVSVDKLPDNFPMQKMRTEPHSNSLYQHVMFIDMPDFDSVEVANRDLVDVWLPHLDVVLYVVSPDRYRDDQGWQLLTAHAKQHAWIFIMNHWDRGEPSQLADFKAQLGGAGLSDPVIFHTDSSNTPKQDADQFDALQKAIQEMADQSIIRSLEELGVVARLKALKSISDPWLNQLIGTSPLKQLRDQWQTHWAEHSHTIKLEMSSRFEQHASFYREPQGFIARRLSGSTLPDTVIPSVSNITDESLLTRLDNGLADFINQQSHSLNIPVSALKQHIAQPYAKARGEVESSFTAALQQSLAKPGNVFQRSLHSVLGFLAVALPLAAMGWVSWRAVSGFIEGGSNPAAYLGSNFAVNAVLLVALSWVIPLFLHKKIKPSRVRAAYRGLQAGLKNALAQLHSAVSSGFDDLAESADKLNKDYQRLWQTLAEPNQTNLPEPVRRMLATEVATDVHRSLDVRANTQSSTDEAPAS